MCRVKPLLAFSIFRKIKSELANAMLIILSFLMNAYRRGYRHGVSPSPVIAAQSFAHPLCECRIIRSSQRNNDP